MPTFEELPVPVQNEFRAKRGEPTDMEHPEKRRLTLLQRLAAVGLGRREDELDQKPEVRPVDPQRAVGGERAPARPARFAEPRSAEPGYPRRGNPDGLDVHSRASAAPAPADDDQLDIPAFLRRQAN
jgi:cell division protein FtsZ